MEIKTRWAIAAIGDQKAKLFLVGGFNREKYQSKCESSPNRGGIGVEIKHIYETTTQFFTVNHCHPNNVITRSGKSLP